MVSAGAGGATAGDVPLAEQAGHLKNFVHVLAQSHTLGLGGGLPQKSFPAGQMWCSAMLPCSDLSRALTAPTAHEPCRLQRTKRCCYHAWQLQSSPETLTACVAAAAGATRALILDGQES